ncbi:MAG TPA: TonB-dependent siderophore receptor [Methylovorus sp.]|nr:TonB-dependent siderophore receptor [Methylovorus sp.]
MKLKWGVVCALLVPYGVAIAEVVEDAKELPEVEVSARQEESATGPVKGYKANRSQTATKTNAALSETPQSVTVIGSEQIRDQGAQSLAEALRFTAGVDAGQRGRRGLDDISIRGFVQSAYVLRDGMRMDNDMWIQNEPFAFERIEVLKGPASVLYGQISPGGLVNMVTKRPTDKPIAEIGVGLGNYNQKQVTADFSDALNEDGTVRYRLVGLSSASDDQVDYVDRQRTYIAPSLTWDISDKTSLTLLASYQKSDFVPIRGLPARGTVQANPNGPISYSRFVGVPGVDKYSTEQTQVGYLFEHAFTPGIKFKQSLRVNDYDLEGAFTSPTSLSTNGVNYARRIEYRDVHGQMLTMDNQLNMQFETAALRHDVLVGFDYLHFDSKRTDKRATVTALNLYNPNYSPTIGAAVTTPTTTGTDKLEQKGLYLQDHIKFGDGWNLVLGLRRDESDLLETRLSGTRTRTDPGATTGRAGLLYAFGNGWSPYVSYSESFVPVTGSGADGSAFKPETGQQREVGVKYETPNKAFGTTVALYDLTRQNVTTTDPSNTAFNIQTGEQQHRGLEIEATGQLTSRLNVVGSYSYIDAEITKSTTGTLHKRPILVAKNMANLWANYDMGRWLQGLGIGIGARYIGKQAGDDLNTFYTPHYTVYDAALFYRTGAWRFALNARNLADKEYVASCSSVSACYTGDPRMIMLNATYAFK